MAYILHNGNYKKEDEAAINAGNRAFLYGDSFFETIRCFGSTPINFETHFKRLSRACEEFELILPELYTENYFKYHIEKLLTKNRIHGGARTRLTIYREAGGLYTPTNNKGGFILATEKLDKDKFELNPKGLEVEVYPDMFKSCNSFSMFKTGSALLNIKAGLYKNKKDLGDCLLLNQYGEIIEAISSNIFILKDNVLFTPDVSSGCVAGTMRSVIIENAVALNLQVEKVSGFLEQDLLEAEEVFLSNAIQGVVWVSAFKEKRYFNFKSKKLANLLNKWLF